MAVMVTVVVMTRVMREHAKSVRVVISNPFQVKLPACLASRVNLTMVLVPLSVRIVYRVNSAMFLSVDIATHILLGNLPLKTVRVVKNVVSFVKVLLFCCGCRQKITTEPGTSCCLLFFQLLGLPGPRVPVVYLVNTGVVPWVLLCV